MKSLRDSKVRLSSAYEILRISDCAELLASRGCPVHGLAEYHAALVPTRDGTIKLITADAYKCLISISGESDAAETIDLCGGLGSFSSLLFDGVFAVGNDGEWESGLSSVDAFIDYADWGPPISGISREAISVCGVLLGTVEETAMALYNYNRVPLTPRWTAEFRTREFLQSIFVRSASDAFQDRLLYELPGPDAAWHVWHAPDRRIGSFHKLYLSPRPEDVIGSFAKIVGALGQSRISAFKVGIDPSNLLRSDKMVAYFDTKSEMLGAVSAVSGITRGLKWQEVPFTNLIAGESLSWGIDPFPDALDRIGVSRASWRSKVVAVVAKAIRDVRQADVPVDLLKWVSCRLRADGIDASRWSLMDG